MWVTIVDDPVFLEGCSDFYCQILVPTSFFLQGFQKDDEQCFTFPFASSGVSECVKRKSSLGIFTSVFQHIQMREKMLNDSKF